MLRRAVDGDGREGRGGGREREMGWDGEERVEGAGGKGLGVSALAVDES